MKARRLAKLKVTRVDLVEKGANPEARVTLLKNESGEPGPRESPGRTENPPPRAEPAAPSSTRRCGKCQNDVDAAARFCPKCAAPLSAVAGASDEKPARPPRRHGTARAEIDARAAEKVAKGLSEDEALAAVLAEEPSLYDDARAEFAKVEHRDPAHAADAPATVVQLRKHASDEQVRNAQAAHFYEQEILTRAERLPAFRAGLMSEPEAVAQIAKSHPDIVGEYVRRQRLTKSRAAAEYTDALLGSELDAVVAAVVEKDAMPAEQAEREVAALFVGWADLRGTRQRLAKSGVSLVQLEAGHQEREQAVTRLVSDARNLNELRASAGQVEALLETIKLLLADRPGYAALAQRADHEAAGNTMSVQQVTSDPALYRRYMHAVRDGRDFAPSAA